MAYLPVLDKKVGEGTGHFFGAMRIDAFQPADQFKKQMDLWIDTFKGAKVVPGQEEVLIPGELEFRKEKKIAGEGINVIGPVMKEMKEIADFLKIEFEEK